MSVRYFRDLATRCRHASRDCFDLFDKEEFRRLAGEFTAKADELDGGHNASFSAGMVEHRKALAIHGSLNLTNALHCTVRGDNRKEQSRIEIV